MQVKRTAIPEVILVVPKKIGDHRGYFSEIYHEAHYAEIGIDARFVQDNQSLSVAKGTVRGLHFQLPPAPQAKLVRVLQGAIFDVAVDIRKGSPTYGKWVGETLTAEAGEQLFVPRGFAHGFCTLTPDTVVAYKVDGYFSQPHDTGISFADPDIGITWPVALSDMITSDKDKGLKRLKDFDSPFAHAG